MMLPITSVLIDVGTFLVEHGDLVNLISDALGAGVTKDELRKAIQATQVAASDAEMRNKLGLPE